jgi:uncharacterized protein YjiS (DUF1127 family)
MTTLTRTRATIRRPRLSLRMLIDLRRSRRALAELDDIALEDIGISRTEARIESKRPIWDAPSAWRRSTF